ncbi:presenilin-like protein At2g29900 [Impatiens glandulifera]|uniref:presenilin-like protein At2g29900 n=1 Tax=Impatiens glandulifera TaxID=253017 RepID=UPI001FB0B425|nr:presenilin-like protein At2g29900 [Impatiens glandulifera]
MDQRQKPISIIDSIGEEIVRIITPVSICMLLVVLLVSILNNGSSSTSINTIATIAYTENISDSIWDKFQGAVLNSLVFIAVVTIVTFALVFLFYLGFTNFLKYYMGFSSFLVLGFMGGEIALLLIEDFSIPIDSFTFLIILFNFTIVGVLAVYMSKMAIFLTQAYLVVIGMVVAYMFTMLPEWTTWVLLIAMSLYDLAAVLLPVGPLRLLVELAISRDEEIPALVYEARPVTRDDRIPEEEIAVRRRVWRDTATVDSSNSSPELSVALMEERTDELGIEGIGLGSSGAIKLGLGDFIFYSVLVGRAAMYDYMTVYACYLAIVAGLGVTLMLLAVYQKALPALPVSVMLGVLFYLLTRFLLEVFVVQCSLHLLMF